MGPTLNQKVTSILVILEMQSNFDKNQYLVANYVGTSYDYKSIMHYGRTAFKKSPYVGNVLEAKFDPEMKLGGSNLSSTDIKELNRLYQCHSKFKSPEILIIDNSISTIFCHCYSRKNPEI